MLDGISSLFMDSNDELKHVGTRTIKYNQKRKRDPESTDEASSTADDNGEEIVETEVEIEFYSTNGEDGLGSMFGLSSEEIDDAVDSIVQQLVTSYLDNENSEGEESSSVDLYTSLFGTGNEGEDGREIELDLNSEEITELLAQIANSKREGNEDGREHSEIFALKFIVEGDEITEPDDEGIDESNTEKVNDKEEDHIGADDQGLYQ